MPPEHSQIPSSVDNSICRGGVGGPGTNTPADNKGQLYLTHILSSSPLFIGSCCCKGVGSVAPALLLILTPFPDPILCCGSTQVCDCYLSVTEPSRTLCILEGNNCPLSRGELCSCPLAIDGFWCFCINGRSERLGLGCLLTPFP